MLQLIKSARALNEAGRIKLPYINEENDSPVLVGAFKNVDYARDALMGAFHQLSEIVDRDYTDYLKFTHKYAAINGLRFHTDEEWAKVGSHLDNWVDDHLKKIFI